MMDKYHDIDKWASEFCGSHHDGETCGNCLKRFNCQSYLDGIPVTWCTFWKGE